MNYMFVRPYWGKLPRFLRKNVKFLQDMRYNKKVIREIKLEGEQTLPRSM